MSDFQQFEPNTLLAPYTTLKAGGRADFASICSSASEIVEVWKQCMDRQLPWSIIGSGSNILVSDKGVRGAVIINRSCKIRKVASDTLAVESGAWLQDVFLKSVQLGFQGLEFAVGIPGTIGGALVSNAGAYRSSIGDFVNRVEVLVDGERKWAAREWLHLSYRNSRLRQNGYIQNSAIVLQVELNLEKGSRRQSYQLAKDYQLQRILKQPHGPSAGSYFKNVEDRDFACSLDFLPDRFKEAGIVPAGFLIEAVHLKGFRMNRVGFGQSHANIIVNYGSQSAESIMRLAQLAQDQVREKFSVLLEPEVVSFGDWN